MRSENSGGGELSESEYVAGVGSKIKTSDSCTG